MSLEGLIHIHDLSQDDSFLLAGLEMRPLVSEVSARSGSPGKADTSNDGRPGIIQQLGASQLSVSIKRVVVCVALV